MPPVHPYRFIYIYHYAPVDLHIIISTDKAATPALAAFDWSHCQDSRDCAVLIERIVQTLDCDVGPPYNCRAADTIRVCLGTVHDLKNEGIHIIASTRARYNGH